MSQPLYHLIGLRGGYWRIGGQGYTTEIAEAGVFSLDYATEAVANAEGVRMVEVPNQEGSYILASNLESALATILSLQSDIEIKYGPHFKSAFRSGLESNLAYLRANGTLEVRPSS